jgi:TolB-like protein
VKSKVTILAIVLMALVFLGCTSLPKLSSSGGQPGGVNISNLNEVLEDAYAHLRELIPRGSKLAFLNIQSSSQALSTEILDGLMEQAVNDRERPRPFTVVDRANLDLIQAEMQFQLSGEVSDATAQEIGRQLGAQTIISGAVTRIGDLWRLRITALEVETAQIQGQYIKNGSSVAGVRIPSNDELDRACRDASDYLNTLTNDDTLPWGSKIVVLVRSDFPMLQEYVNEELTRNTVEDGNFTAVDRVNLELIQREMAYQLSGEVSEDSAAALGEKLGAQLIVIGDVSGGNQLRIRAISVRTAGVEALKTFRFDNSFIVEQMTRISTQQVAAAARASVVPPRRAFDLETAIGFAMSSAKDQAPNSGVYMGETADTQSGVGFDWTSRFFVTPNVAILFKLTGGPKADELIWYANNSTSNNSLNGYLNSNYANGTTLPGTNASSFLVGVDGSLYLGSQFSLNAGIGFGGLTQSYENTFSYSSESYKMVVSRAYYGPGLILAARWHFTRFIYAEAGGSASYYFTRSLSPEIKKRTTRTTTSSSGTSTTTSYTSWYKGDKTTAGGGFLYYQIPYVTIGFNLSLGSLWDWAMN